ncbi:MAG TPA: SpoIID/LytB domain-containing protein [Planctomycetota bacterium]|nr:SpoIID/LytB domain-containing protein [Planctomycetota bacterium]
MDRGSIFHAVAVAATCWFVFVVHACGASRPLRDDHVVGAVTPAPAVQVGLSRCLRDPAVRIAVRGPWRLRGGAGVLSEGDAELDWTDVRATPDGLSFGGRVWNETVLELAPRLDGTLEIEYARDLRGQPVRPTAVRYAGIFLIHRVGDARLAVVNEVDLETYLKGVVGKEMSLSEGVEALKTQVVAARTYAVHEQRTGRLRRIRGERFDLYDDERSQAYGGLERHTDLAERLVDETRGMFLVYEDRLVRAFYSAACGGATEPAWEILGDETEKMPPLSGVRCGYCERRPAHKWKEPAVIPKREISEKCLPPELRGAKVKSVAVTKTLPGGHALEVSVTLENSSRVVVLQAHHEFKRQVTARLRSTLWDVVEDRGDAIAIHGRGNGHGAGMCQVGAYEMAADGKTAAEILEYYFPGARVKKLY